MTAYSDLKNATAAIATSSSPARLLYTSVVTTLNLVKKLAGLQVMIAVMMCATAGLVTRQITRRGANTLHSSTFIAGMVLGHLTTHHKATPLPVTVMIHVTICKNDDPRHYV